MSEAHSTESSLAIAIAFVFFAAAAACLYAIFRAMLADAGLFVFILLVLAGVNAAAGALNWTGASPVLLTVSGTLLCIYAFIAFIWAVGKWDDAFMEGYRHVVFALAVAFALTAAAILQFVYVV